MRLFGYYGQKSTENHREKQRGYSFSSHALRLSAYSVISVFKIFALVCGAPVFAQDELIERDSFYYDFITANKEVQEQMLQSGQTITPAAAPYVSEGSDLFATLDFLWWKTAISGAEFAYTGTADGGQFVPFGSNTGGGRVRRPELDFEPGFKLGLGVNFEYDGWDLYANYTYLYDPSETKTVSATGGTGAASLLRTQLNSGTPAFVTLINDTCKWSQDFNVIDLELGRNFFVSRHLTMRPHAGLKTGWLLDRGIFTLRPTTTTTDATGTEVLGVKSERRQHTWGLGIRTGMNTGWHLSGHWSFYADFALTTLWSDFHIKNTDTITEINTITMQVTGPTQTLNAKETFETVMPVIEAGLGLSYNTWWDQRRYRFELRAGWEEQVWIDYNHFMVLGQAGGSFTVQGLTAKVSLTF